jgi:hypothetical protein
MRTRVDLDLAGVVLARQDPQGLGHVAKCCEVVHARFTRPPRWSHAGRLQSARVVKDTTKNGLLMLLLTLLANPRLAHVRIHRRIDDRFDHSDLERFDVGGRTDRVSMRSRSAAVTERLPAAGMTDHTEM